MKLTPLTLVIPLLAGCASVYSHQDTCETLHKSFVDSVSCLKDRLNNGPQARRDALIGGKDDPLVTLYLLKADELSDLVRSGKITDRQARIELFKTRQEITQTRAYEAIGDRRPVAGFLAP